MTESHLGNLVDERRKQPFTMVDNLVFDGRLDLLAIGLYAYILSKPPGWYFAMERIAEELPNGLRSIRAAMDRIEGAGLITRQRRKDGRMIYTLHDIEPKCQNSNDATLSKPKGGHPCETSGVSKTKVRSKNEKKDANASSSPDAVSAPAPKKLGDESPSNKTPPPKAPPPDSAALDDEKIVEIYNAYPRKVGKGAAIKAIAKAVRGQPIREQRRILVATRAFAHAVAHWPERDRKYIPHPSTWFNQLRFDDDPSEWDRGGSPDYSGNYSGNYSGALEPTPEGSFPSQYTMEQWAVRRPGESDEDYDKRVSLISDDGRQLFTKDDLAFMQDL